MTSALPSCIALLPILVLWAGALSAGCTADTSGLQTLSIDQLSALREGGAELTLLDVNNDDTRERLGVIPDAVLLTSYRDYDAVTELPGDRSRQIVFYCTASTCSAAAEAARKAVAAGWRNVWVMPEGLRGWKDAGLAVEQPAPTVAG